MASLYGSRLLRAAGRSTLMQQRVAAPSRSHFTTATATRASSMPQTALAAQVAALCRSSNRIPKRMNSHAIAKRAFASKSTPPPKTTAAEESASLGEDSASAEAPESTKMDNMAFMGNPFFGVSARPFSPDVSKILRRPIDPKHIEIKPDGILYLPEILYRSILFDAFGPGGWGLIPRGAPQIGAKVVTREWALFAQGRFISQAIGEGTYFSPDGIPRAVESSKSNALMRCCKDLGISADLWNKRYVRKWKTLHGQEIWVEHLTLKKKAKIWIKKGDTVEYPFKKVGVVMPAPAAKIGSAPPSPAATQSASAA